MVERLSYISGQRYLAKRIANSDRDAQRIKKQLSKKFKIPVNRITYHSAFD